MANQQAAHRAVSGQTGNRVAPKTSMINDPKVRGIFYQVLVGVIVLTFAVWIGLNTAANLEAQGKTTGFDFLGDIAKFDIFFTLIPYSRASTYFQAFIVGLLNTILVSAIGIVLATILGFLLGIARLSNNWIIARLATIYVETLRNIPLLLQLFFWYFSVLKAMPSVRQSFEWFGAFVLNLRGFYVPRPIFDERFIFVVASVVVAIAAVFAIHGWAKRRLMATGRRFPVLWTSLAVLIVLPFIVWMASGTVLQFEYPSLQGFNYKGGLAMPPEFVALLLGLTLYTAAFIGEIVRAGIQAINKGQTEAAQSLGLKDGDRLRLVIIPQAMRVIVPPLTSQYLNLTKNSSLAVAIGYPELVSVFMGTTLNQSGRYLEVVFITMLVYLTLSLSTSAFMNWYNARVALVER